MKHDIQPRASGSVKIYDFLGRNRQFILVSCQYCSLLQLQCRVILCVVNTSMAQLSASLPRVPFPYYFTSVVGLLTKY